MNNPFSITPEGTCSGDVTGGSLWTGESLRAFFILTVEIGNYEHLGLFYLQGGATMATEEKIYEEIVLRASPRRDDDIIRRTYPDGRTEYLMPLQYSEDRILNSEEIWGGDLGDLMHEYIWDMQDLVGIMDADGIRMRLYRCLKFIREIYEKRIE